jgi:preprotein translocase subunit YajC
MLKKLLKQVTSSLSVLSLLAITGLAQATETTQAVTQTDKHPGSAGYMVWLPLILIATFYFLMIRPQNKRQRDQKELLNQITLGDEVMTTSGILGKIIRLRDNYIVLSVNKQTEITISRSAVSQVLPKGTIDSIN